MKKKKLNHREKQRLARRMRTKDEIKRRTPIFQTEFWEARKARLARKRNSKKRKKVK